MGLQELRDRIEDKTARVVVIGLGYVGLPVSCCFARSGFDVTGLDVDERKVTKVNAGVSPIEGYEPGLAELVREVVAQGRFRATTGYAVCQSADVILIAVETPIDSTRQPRYQALRAALRSLRPHLQTGAMVIVESTIAPGTLDRLVRPALEAHGERQSGRDFFLAHLISPIFSSLS